MGWEDIATTTSRSGSWFHPPVRQGLTGFETYLPNAEWARWDQDSVGLFLLELTGVISSLVLKFSQLFVLWDFNGYAKASGTEMDRDFMASVANHGIASISTTTCVVGHTEDIVSVLGRWMVIWD